MKGKISVMMGTILGFIVSQMGGWSEGLAALVLFMGIDYVSGLVVAGVFHQSKKSKNGALESWELHIFAMQSLSHSARMKS